MVKRSGRNVGKWVRVLPCGSVFDNRVGVVKGFRGDFQRNTPYVLVAIKNIDNDHLGGLYTFAGSRLEYIKS